MCQSSCAQGVQNKDPEVSPTVERRVQTQAKRVQSLPTPLNEEATRPEVPVRVTIPTKTTIMAMMTATKMTTFRERRTKKRTKKSSNGMERMTRMLITRSRGTVMHLLANRLPRNSGPVVGLPKAGVRLRSNIARNRKRVMIAGRPARRNLMIPLQTQHHPPESTQSVFGNKQKCFRQSLQPRRQQRVGEIRQHLQRQSHPRKGQVPTPTPRPGRPPKAHRQVLPRGLQLP